MSSNTSRIFLKGFLVFFLAFLVVAVIGLNEFISNKPAIRNYCRQTEEFITINQTTWETVFTQYFDQAKSCQGNITCEENIHQLLMHSLVGKEELQHFPSTYFIRLNQDQEIEKLFLSGVYRTTPAKTSKQNQVVKLLQGKRSRICDQGWKLDGDDGSMVYLYDMWAEAEIILPVKSDNKTIGAVVKAWGD